jgi:hypothetical protein
MNKLVTAAVVGGAAIAVGVLPAAGLASAATAPTPIPVPVSPSAPATTGSPVTHAPIHRKPGHHKKTTKKGHRTRHPVGTGTGGTGKPVSHRHPAHHPVKHRPVHQPVGQKPVGQKPVAHQPVAHQPVAHKPVRKPVVHKPVNHKPAPHKPVRKPVVTTPVVHPPVIGPPIVEPPIMRNPVHKPVSPTTAARPAQLAMAPGIVGGKNVTNAPWAVQVSWDDTGFECSGTAVAPQWVLTAGHCASTGGMTVLIGSPQLGQGTKEVVDNKVVDPDADLALLHLTDPVHTTYVTLADQDPDVGSINEIYGWGKTSDDSGPSDQLKSAKVKVTATDCVDGVGAPAICSTGITGNAFNGDSGGPEIADGTEVGVCSTGNADEKTQEYTSVAANRDWLRQVANV